MILVDTTVWIDLFADRHNKQTSCLIQLIENQEDLCICGVILTEILQGIKSVKERHLVEESLDSVIFLDMTRETFELGADIFSELRKQGVTIRKTIDCLIAAVAIENHIPLLHNDRDFDFIKKHHQLKVK